MKLLYANGRFEARFSQDFQGDLDAVKAAGFKPDTSSGSWVWHTAKIPVLEKLREKRPASGIAIDNETFEKYKELAAQFEKNEEVKKAAKALEKARKKESEDKAKEENCLGDRGSIQRRFRHIRPLTHSIHFLPQPDGQKRYIYH